MTTNNAATKGPRLNAIRSDSAKANCDIAERVLYSSARFLLFVRMQNTEEVGADPVVQKEAETVVYQVKQGKLYRRNARASLVAIICNRHKFITFVCLDA